MHSVLIIEDDPITLYVYKSHLEKAGFNVKIAKDGEAAFCVLQKTPPDAILLDLMLPRINGVEILKTIRAHKDFETIPVFVFTNLHLSNLAKDAAKAGANRVFDKATAVPLEIIEAIRAAVSHLPATSAHEGVSQPPATEAGGPSQPVFESCPEIGPELLRASINKVPETLMALRKILQKLSKADDTAERLSQLSELFENVHAVTSVGSSSELHGLSQMGAALEAFVRQLSEDSKQINVSTLRTVSHAIDFLDVLFKRGIRDDSSESMPLSILVVDDDRLSRMAITSALAGAKLKLSDVESPHLALRLLKDSPFDLVFLDVTMPEMNGFELCLELRKLPHHKTTPVVFVTSLSDFESRSRSTLSGGNDLITKPFLFSELAVKTLMYALKGRFAQTASVSSKTSFTHKPAAERRTNPDVQIEVIANSQPALAASARQTENQTSEPSSRLAAPAWSISGVITMDESGVIRSLNWAADTLFGYETSEAVGLPITCLIPDAHQTNTNQILIGQLIRGKEKVIKSVTHFVGERKDKSTFFLSLSLSEIMLASRRMFTCIVRDLSEPAKAKDTSQPLVIEAQAAHLAGVNESSETGIKTAAPPPTDTARTVRCDDDQTTQAEPLTGSKQADEVAERVPVEKDLQVRAQTEELTDARAELKKASAERMQLTARLQELADTQVGLKQELEKRKQSEADLIKVQENLEFRVQERSNELAAAQTAWQTETAEREKLEVQTKELCSSQAARALDLEQRKQFEDRLRQKQKELEAQLQQQGDALKKTQEEARKENEERQRVEALIKRSTDVEAALNQELADRGKSEDAWRARYEELEQQFKDQNLHLAKAKSDFEREMEKRQQAESDTQKLLSAQAGVPPELIDRQQVEAELRQTKEDFEARVGKQSQKLAKVQAEYQQESTKRQWLETRTQELSDKHTALIEQNNQLQQLEKILREKEHALDANAHDLNAQLSRARNELDTEISERKRLEAQAAELASDHNALTNTLEQSKQAEATLKRAHEDLEGRFQTQTSESANTGSELQKEVSERSHLETRVAKLSAIQNKLNEELNKQSENKTLVERERDGLAARYQEQSKTLSEAQAQLDNELSHRQKFEEDASTLAGKLKRFEEELSHRDLVEENLRRAKEEIEARVEGEAPKLAQLETQLLKATTERQRAEAHATELFKTQIESAQELSQRKQTEDALRKAHTELEARLQTQAEESAHSREQLQSATAECQRLANEATILARAKQELLEREQIEQRLRRTHTELEERVGHQTAELTRVQALLEKEIADREKLEARAVELARVHASLTQEASDRVQPEQALRTANSELQGRLKERGHELSKIEAQLQQEKVALQQTIAQRDELARSQAQSNQRLDNSRQAEETLRRTQEELEIRAQHQARELARVQTDLEKEICERQRVIVRSAEVADGHAALVSELNERKQIELDLRLVKEQLASNLESQNTRLTQVQARLLTEVSERQRLETHASELGKAHFELSQQLTQKTETEAALRQAYVELGTTAEERLGQLTQTQAHLENTLTERDQAVLLANELAQKKALVQEQLSERQKVDEASRKTQKELEGRIETQTADLARAEAERKIQISDRGQLEQRAAELAKTQMGLKQELSQRNQTEEALRRAYAELGEAAQARGNELTETGTQLQKEIALREQVEVQAARLKEALSTVEKELNTRRLAEQTLQQSQHELDSIIKGQATRFASIETELQHQTAERTRFESDASNLTAANFDLTREVSEYKENEANLHRAQEQLKSRNDAATKELASVQAKLEKEVTEHLQLIDTITGLTSIQAELKCALEDQRKIEEILRRSETELATRVNTQVAEFGFLQTELQKEIAQREHAQAQAARLLETKGSLEEELDARQLAEQTLQQSQQDMESVIQSHVAQLCSLETELQHQMAERLRLDDQTSKLAAANSDLAKRLSYSQETEATLRCTQDQLQAGSDALAKDLARVEAKLEKEIVEHIQLMDDSADLTNAQAVLKRALEEQRNIEENLRRSETELGNRVNTQAAEFSFLQAELQREIARREQVGILAQELATSKSGLLEELEERNASDHALRVIQADLRVQIQAQVSEFEHLQSELGKENQERLRATQRATELGKIQIALKEELFDHKQIEDRLRRIHEELEIKIEMQASELANTRAALELEISELKQAKENSAELVTEQAVFKREIAERKAIEEELRQRQSELEVRLHNSTRALASAQANEQEENAKRTSLETELSQIRYSTLEFSRVKSEFLHNLSQQIRQPANRVLEISGKLRKTPLTGEHHQLLETLQASVEELLGSDRRIAEFSRFQVEPVRFEALPFDLYSVVEGAIESSRALVQGKDIELASLVYQEVPTFLRGDQNRLRQILQHLVTTSLKFTQNGPVLLRVTTESDCQTDATLRFCVSGGRPNDFEEIQQWVEPALREAGSPAISATGAMLELAVARQLIEMSLGKFGMEPGADEGAVLWCTLRFAKLSMVAGSVQDPIASLSALRALVVESHHARSEVFSSQLTAGGVRNSTIFNAVDALSLLRNQALAGDPFSVAIVSIDLPEMDGLTLAKIAKAEPLLNATHFIIALAATKLPDETQITAAGVSAWLIRPITQSQLFAILERTIGKTGEQPSGKNEAQWRSVTPATQPNTVFPQNLQIVRAGPLGEAPLGTIHPFQHLS